MILPIMAEKKKKQSKNDGRILLGVPMALQTEKLSKNTRMNGKELLRSQVGSLEAHAALSRQVYNWVTALYLSFLKMKDDYIREKGLGYANNDEQALCSLKASVYAMKQKTKNDEDKKGNKKKRTKPKDSDPVPLSAKIIEDFTHVDAVTGEVFVPTSVTYQEAKEFDSQTASFYKQFNEEHAYDAPEQKHPDRNPRKLPSWILKKQTIEYVYSQIVGSVKEDTHRFVGNVLYDSLADSNVLPQWFTNLVIEQESLHPLYRYDNRSVWVPVGEDENIEMFPVPRRVAVNEIENACNAVEKHRKRFFKGGNPKQGKPKFRKYKDDQTFAISMPDLFLRQGISAAAKNKFLSGISLDSSMGEDARREAEGKLWAEEKHKRKTSWDRLASGSRIRLGYLGNVPVSKHSLKRLISLLNEGGELAGEVRLSRRSGQWSAAVSVRMPVGWKRKRPDSYKLGGASGEIGADPGVIDAVITSTGYSISNISRNPRHIKHVSTPSRTKQERHFAKALSHEDASFERLRYLDEKLKMWQRKASYQYEAAVKANDGKRKGAIMTPKWHEAQTRIRKINAQIANIRAHHRNVIAKILAANYDFVGLESLNTKGMLAKVLPKTDDAGKYIKNGRKAKSGLSRAISAVGFGSLLLLIKQKAGFYGTTVQEINQWFASSKMCSNCGAVKSKAELPLHVREYHCDSCGFVCGRDENAARNIVNEALRIYHGGNEEETQIDRDIEDVSHQYYKEIVAEIDGVAIDLVEDIV